MVWGAARAVEHGQNARDRLRAAWLTAFPNKYLSKPELATGKLFLIAVHGTADAAPVVTERTDDLKWWQANSAFSAKLIARISPDVGAEWIEFHWTGENLESHRQVASKELSALIDEKLCQHHDVALVAHSHGGNVVRLALEHTKHQNREFVRVFTIASPFFVYENALLRALRVLSAVVFLTILAAAFVVLYAFLAGYLLALLSGAAVLVLAALFVIPFHIVSYLISQTRKLWSGRAPRYAESTIGTWTCIYSVNDEAMALLTFLARRLRKDSISRDERASKIARESDIASNFVATGLLALAVAYGGGLRFGDEQFVISADGAVVHDLGRSLYRVQFVAPIVPAERSPAGWLEAIRSVNCRDGRPPWSVEECEAEQQRIEGYTILRKDGVWFHPISVGAFVFDGAETTVSAWSFWSRASLRALSRFPWLNIDNVRSNPWPWVVGVPAGLIASILVYWLLQRFAAQWMRASFFSTRLVGDQLQRSIENAVVRQYARRLAYGDDCDARIVGIRTTPWRAKLGSEEVQLGDDVHIALENFVAGAYSTTMKRIREALTPEDGVMGARDWKRLLDCLSWDELAHTAYFREPRVMTEIVEICAIRIDRDHPPVTRRSDADGERMGEESAA